MKMNKYDLKGQVAVVTGGSSGIGRAIALGIAEAGADVVLASRKLPNLEQVAELITKLGRRALPVATHMRKPEDISNLVQQATAEFGKIDILINDAANLFGGSALETEERTWDETFNVNLKGPFLLSQAVAKVMVEQKSGSIINMSSYAGIIPHPGATAYSISKAAVIMLTKVMAKEWGQYNIRVNAIAPGYVHTKMTEPLRGTQEDLSKLEASIPLGRIAQPEDIVSAALFLASGDSSYITGHTLLVDGGVSL